MRMYYLSRAFVALAFGGLWLASGSSWLAAGLAAGVALGLTLLAPRSGLYAVHPERGVTAMADDERTRAIRDKAARNAFVGTLLALGGLEVYFRSAGLEAIPFPAVNYVLLFGVVVYWFFNIYLRRV